MKQYQSYINQIRNIDWSRIDPLQIICVSLFFAKEFTQSVRACMPHYGHLPEFQQFIAGEIDTNNLSYEDYHATADHWQFLNHFLLKESPSEHIEKAYTSYEYVAYTFFIDAAYTPMKLLTLVSRERELQGIFEKILHAHDWDVLGYGFYKYFLERHLELDGEEGGHEDMMSKVISLDSLTEESQELLRIFWKLRAEIYMTLIDEEN